MKTYLAFVVLAVYLSNEDTTVLATPTAMETSWQQLRNKMVDGKNKIAFWLTNFNRKMPINWNNFFGTPIDGFFNKTYDKLSRLWNASVKSNTKLWRNLYSYKKLISLGICGEPVVEVTPTPNTTLKPFSYLEFKKMREYYKAEKRRNKTRYMKWKRKEKRRLRRKRLREKNPELMQRLKEKRERIQLRFDLKVQAEFERVEKEMAAKMKAKVIG